ncbi:hypothetical protein [Ruegeria sp. HKCCD7318]|uniref:hypothetical protein n=1 Tax=Ruegeria sp. HKCCD7318 TaxID=2683014 RepID=UPI001490ED32|nr:hypothetical protein [Ruegeria sp. HKCCD7318]NOE33879.1 hypothetical protein [Ruegeria sp. HKCCD7318]
MSRLYSVIERSELLKAARDLIEPSRPPSDDPVLGAPPEIVFRWNTFTKKHGSLVERVMTKVIQHAPGWRPASQTRFKCDTSATKKLIDRIAINHANEVAIFIECKRNLGNVSNPYLRSIREYDRWCQDNSTDIASELGFGATDPVIRFAVFNAYGELEDRDKVKGIPVLTPKDLQLIFGFPVLEAFQELHRVVQSVVIENEIFRPYSQGLDLPRIDAIPMNAIEEARVESQEGFRRRISATLDQLTFRGDV